MAAMHTCNTYTAVENKSIQMDIHTSNFTHIYDDYEECEKRNISGAHAHVQRKLANGMHFIVITFDRGIFKIYSTNRSTYFYAESREY